MGNEITVTTQNLPANIEDLTKFALIGRDKLEAVRAEIRAINKLGLAQEVYEQKLREAQDIADAVLDAEVKIGELMAKVPKASGGDHGNQYTGGKNIDSDNFAKPKSDVIRDAGLTPAQVSQFQRMADHPEIVEQAKAEARGKEDIVTRKDVMDRIRKEDGNKPRGYSGTAETREIFKAVYAAIDNEGQTEFDIDDLIDEIKINGENYIRSLRNTVSIRTNLLNEVTKKRVFTAIAEVIQGIVKVRGEYAV